MTMLLSDSGAACAPPEGCFASYCDGIVTLGNSLFARRWSVTGQGITATSFQLGDREFLTAPTSPFPVLKDASWRTYGAPLSCTGEAALHAVLTLPGGASWHFALTPGVSGVAVERFPVDSGAACAARDGGGEPSGLEVDPAAKEGGETEFLCCESFRAASPHLRLREFRFADQTDRHDNLLSMIEYRLSPVEEIVLSGTLFAVEDPLSGLGMILLKFAPLPERRPMADPLDFRWDTETFSLHGDRYPWATIGYEGGRAGFVRSLHLFQQRLRKLLPGRDGLALSNTWGDRNRDQALNEAFMLEEIGIAAEIGIDVCQIDDGWQAGVTVNSSKAKESGGGVWEGYHAANPNFWQVHPERFPRGLAPLVGRAGELGVGLGLWFSPDSSGDFENYRKDVATVCDFQQKFGVNWIKIDGVKSRTCRGEANLRSFFRAAVEDSSGKLTFDLDVTAEIRPGYFGMPEFGPLFVENRYSDWRRWWPYATFRNLWQLSQVIPPVRLRMECLNPMRNQEKYRNDPLAPALYPMDWIFASVMVASPLIWCELSSLSAKNREELGQLVKVWKKFRGELHSGVTYPVGPCPDGGTTSGFFTVSEDESVCHLVLLRDFDREAVREVALPFVPQGYSMERIAGSGECELTAAGLRCIMTEVRSYLWMRFTR